MSPNILMLAGQNGVFIVELDHMLIEGIKLMVSEICSICKIPSPSAVVIAPVVAFPRKINPLWMPKLVAHEVKVSVVSQTKGD